MAVRYYMVFDDESECESFRNLVDAICSYDSTTLHIADYRPNVAATNWRLREDQLLNDDYNAGNTTAIQVEVTARYLLPGCTRTEIDDADLIADGWDPNPFPE